MILVIDNYDSFTWNLVQRLGEINASIEPGRGLEVVRHDAITPVEAEAIDGGAGPSHIIISPGPCTPREAGVSGAVVERFAGRVPILGVCLGHQCIAHSHGMAVIEHPVLMHGKTSEVEHDGRTVFAGLASPFTAMRYHSLIVPETAVPPPPTPGEDGWEISAWTTEALGDGARIVMGLRRVWGQPTRSDGRARQPMEGVQFHPESFMTSEGPKLLANFLAMGERPKAGRAATTAP